MTDVCAFPSINFVYNYKQCISNRLGFRLGFDFENLKNQDYLSGETLERLDQLIVVFIIVLAIFQCWCQVFWPWLREMGSDIITFLTQNITGYQCGVVVFIVTILIQLDESSRGKPLWSLDQPPYILCLNIPMIIALGGAFKDYASKKLYNRKVLANQLKVAAKRKPTPKPESLEWYDALFLIATLCYGMITCITTGYINYIFDLVGPLPIVWLWQCKSNTIRDNYPRCLDGDQESSNKRYDEYNFWLKSGYKLWWWAFSSRFIITFAIHTCQHYLHWTSGNTSFPFGSTMLCQFADIELLSSMPCQFFTDTLIFTTICDVMWCAVLYIIHVAYMQKSHWVRDWVQWTCPIIWTDNYGLSDNYWPPANDAPHYIKINMQFQTEKWWNLNHDKSKTTDNRLFFMILVRMILTVWLKYKWMIMVCEAIILQSRKYLPS